MAKLNVSILVPLLGDYFQIQAPFIKFIEKLSFFSKGNSLNLEFIFVADNALWYETVDLLNNSATPPFKLITNPTESMPSCLFNQAAKVATGEFLAFLWIGIDLHQWMLSLEKLIASVKQNDIFLAGESPLNLDKQLFQSWLLGPDDFRPDKYSSGWIELADIVPMSCCLVRRSNFEILNGFSTSPLLQRGFWWDFSLRISDQFDIRFLKIAPPQSLYTWYSYPLTYDLGISGDLMSRRVMRRSEPKSFFTKTQIFSLDWSDIESFALSLSTEDTAYLNKQVQRFISLMDLNKSIYLTFPLQSVSKPLRITVIGGLHETAHNQLCFFNYFSLLEKNNLLTWRTILDTTASPADMLKSDLLIFSRVKSKQGCILMNFCNTNHIPTIYMLDDNWFTMGKDWPEYAKLFHSGNPIYEHFLYCLKNATACLTYNKKLASYMQPYAKKLVVLHTNIDLSLFNRQKSPTKREIKIVGYAGSVRFNTYAFLALREILSMRNDIRLFIMSNKIPHELKNLPPDYFIFEPYVFGYKTYAHILNQYKPDILLAPLGKTDSDASKCPNKYLEIAAIGAAGIYSKVEPYTSFVQEKKTGILVENNVEAWKKAIIELIENDQLRTEIINQSYDDVKDNFSTPESVDKFWSFIKSIAKQGKYP